MLAEIGDIRLRIGDRLELELDVAPARTHRAADTDFLSAFLDREEKIQLFCAVLSQHTGADLVPAFRLWRLPVTAENVAAIRAKYLEKTGNKSESSRRE